MRILLLIILTSLPLILKAQIDFESDLSQEPIMKELLSESVLETSDFDSIQFELRFWLFGNFGGFLQLTLDKKDNWKYRRGYLSDSLEVIQIESLNQQPNTEKVWSELLEFDVLTLPDQDSLTYNYNKDGRVAILTPNNLNTEQFIHNTFDADGYSIELISKYKYRRYFYYNPVGLSKSFKESGWHSPETDKFAAIVAILSNNYQMNDVYRENLIDKMKLKKTNKRR